MNCSRCHGLMVNDHFLDFDGTIGHMWAKGYRCMNCGNVHDPVIERHRLAREQQALVLSNGELDINKGQLHPEVQSAMPQAA